MSDVTLSDGRELTVNLKAFTIREYRDILRPEQGREEALDAEDKLIAKAVDLSLEEYQNLPMEDWKLVSRRFFDIVLRPVDDPNSASASTST